MASGTQNFKVLSRLSFFIEDLMKQTIDYLSNRFQQSKGVFTVASPFGQILLVIEKLTQLVFYYIEDSITELNILEATRLSSVYSLASLAGHNPSRAVSAIGEISVSTNVDAVDAPIDFVIIGTQTRLSCLNNGLTYILDLPQDEIRFSYSGADNGLKLAIRQGILETQRFVSKGSTLESFSVGGAQSPFIDNFYLNVYVNGEKWQKYESILDMPRGEKAYLAKTGITTGLDIYFGNNNFGLIPPRGAEITVEYLITEGFNGNLRTNDPNQVKFQFVDTGFSILGEEIDLNEFITITTTHPPFFGSNSEDSRLTRLIAPRQSKSFALVNADHYEILLKKLKLFSVISVYLDDIDSRMLNLFLIPDIRKTFSTGQDYFNADLDRFILTDYQKNELLRYIEKSGSKLISTDVRIVDPIPSNYVINTSIIAFDDVDSSIINRDILNALGTFFIQNTRRSRIPKSDLIKIIEEINGVDSVSVNIVSKNNELNKIANPNAPDVSIDEFNDIITLNNELPIIRGGFSDRYGNYYTEGLSDDALGCVNIRVRQIVPRPKNN
jgi:hypothetical protein